MGPKGKAPQDAAIMRFGFDGFEGVAISNGILPRYGDIDAYQMSAGAFDEAIRQIISAGGSLPNTNTNDGSTVSSEKYGASSSCTEVWLYMVSGGGHDWPGAYGNMDIDASREAWMFFEQLCEQPVGLIEKPDSSERKLNKIIDLMGRELKESAVGINIYQYSDGTIEKRVKAN